MPTRFQYIVLCHTDAPAALRLARRIRELSPDAGVLLRHDQPADFITPQQAAEVGAKLLRSDIHVNWAGYSMTRATLEALTRARATSADYFVLISGQDYPVRKLTDWELFIVAGGVDAAFGHESVDGLEDRYKFAWLEPFPAPRWVPAIVDRAAAVVAGRVAPRLGALIRCFRNGRDHLWAVGVRRPSIARGKPTPIPFEVGSQWVTLSGRAVDHVLNSHARDGRTRRFFATSRVTDETYIQSLVRAHPDLKISTSRSTYARMMPGKSSPEWLTIEDIDAAAASRAPFARKIPPNVDQQILDRADQYAARDGIAHAGGPPAALGRQG